MNYEACGAPGRERVRDNGLIRTGNILREGKAAVPTGNDEETVAISDFSTMIRAGRRVSICLGPIGDGVTPAVKNRNTLYAPRALRDNDRLYR